MASLWASLGETLESLSNDSPNVSADDGAQIFDALQWACKAYTDASDGEATSQSCCSQTLTDFVRQLPSSSTIRSESECGTCVPIVQVESSIDNNGSLHIACRGTVNDTDWSTNLQMSFVPWDIIGDACVGHAAHVHAGFHRSARAALPNVLQAIKGAVMVNDVAAMTVKELRAMIRKAGLSDKDCFEKEDLHNRAQEAQQQVLQHPLRRLVFSGHSMGGAVALLLGLCVAAREDVLQSWTGSCAPLRIDIVTFGAPQVGDADFGDVVQSNFDKVHITRVVLQSDPVPRLLDTVNGLKTLSAVKEAASLKAREERDGKELEESRVRNHIDADATVQISSLGSEAGECDYFREPRYYAHYPLDAVVLDSGIEAVGKLAQAGVAAVAAASTAQSGSSTTSSTFASILRTGAEAMGAASARAVKEHGLDEYIQYTQRMMDRSRSSYPAQMDM